MQFHPTPGSKPTVHVLGDLMSHRTDMQVVTKGIPTLVPVM